MSVDFSKPVLCDGGPCEVIAHKGDWVWVWINGKSINSGSLHHIALLTNAPERREIWLRVWEGSSEVLASNLPYETTAHGLIDYRITIEGDDVRIERVK